MSTVSTKSRSPKKKGAPVPESRGKPQMTGPEPVRELVSGRTFTIAAAAILLLGAILRLADLNLVPFHHDEGVNGNFLVRLVREGVYNYDPANYHGPTLYYFSAIIPWTIRLFSSSAAQDTYGLTTFNIRLVPALFGLGTIWLVLTLRRHLGNVGALSAALLLAISPGAVYLSRYFIHESLFVFFTLGIVVAALKYYEEAHPVYLILASASAALLFATKETWIISAAVLLIAMVSTLVYRRLFGFGLTGQTQKRKQKGKNSNTSLSLWWSETVERFGGARNVALWSAIAVIVFVLVGVLFYSSFFTNSKGVSDSIKTFEVWTKTGSKDHVHDMSTYLMKWLIYQESALLGLGIMGAAFVVLRPANAFAVFSALWAFGMIAAYSYVPYKTPWLMLNFIVPLALIGGYAIEWIYQELGTRDVEIFARWLGVAGVLVLATSILPGTVAARYRSASNIAFELRAFAPGFQTIDVNFRNYDNDNQYYVYVYAHTRRDLLKLVDEVDRITRRSSTGKDTGVTIVSPDYWPLPWYFRDYKHVGYFARMTTSTEPIIIASETQRSEMQTNFGGYRQLSSGLNPAGSFDLRPGVELLLYVRSDAVAP